MRGQLEDGRRGGGVYSWDTEDPGGGDGDGEDPGDDDDDMAGDDDDTSGGLTQELEQPEWEYDEYCEEASDWPSTFHLTNDDSNSQAAPVFARQLIGEDLVGLRGIRQWEFLNYYEFDYDRPGLGDLRIEPQIRAEEDGVYTLVAAVVSPPAIAFARRPRSLTFSVDASGSMGVHAAELAREVVRQCASNLLPGDRVSLVMWDSETRVLLENHEVIGHDDPDLLAAVEQIDSSGSTNLHDGLVKAYELAEDAYATDRMNRVILISDGGANVGETDEQLIAAHAEDGEAEGIYLVGVGAAESAGYFQDLLMNQVTDAGKGAYLFVDTAEEVKRSFGDDDRFISLMEVAARDVQLSIHVPAQFVMAEFFGEQDAENPDEVEPQHLAPGDAMLFHQVLVDCSDEPDTGQQLDFTVSWVDRDSGETHTETVTTTVQQMIDAAGPQLTKADAAVTYATALEGAIDLPGKAAVASLGRALAEVEAAREAADDADLEEMAMLLTAYRRLFTPAGLQDRRRAEEQQRELELEIEARGDTVMDRP